MLSCANHQAPGVGEAGGVLHRGIAVTTAAGRGEEAFDDFWTNGEGTPVSFRAAPIGMAVAAADGRLLHVNRALCEMTGYTIAELLTLSAQALTHPDDRLQLLAAYQAMQQSGRGKAEARGLRKDRTSFERQVVLVRPRTSLGSSAAHYYFIRALRPRTQSTGEPKAPASDSVRVLVPVCAWCKQVRNDAGYWEQLETCVLERRDVSFTHGMCPECYRREVAALDAARR